jgi:CheY-like chemotaxis protein
MTVRLPADRVVRGADADVSSQSVVLVVEDDDLVPEFALSALKDVGVRAIAASSGNEALGHIESEPRLDVLFTDVVMPPGMSGIELAQRAQRRWPGLKVLFASGFGEKAIAYAEGGVDTGELLVKPYLVGREERLSSWY